jgi:hypothetical protein
LKLGTSYFWSGNSLLDLARIASVPIGQGEVALAMTESILQALGAIPEQIDRQRERAPGRLVWRP